MRQGVKFPDPTTWKPDSNNNQHSDDIVNTVLDDEELKFETNDGKDWSDRDDDDENNSVSNDNARHSNRISEPNHNPPPTRCWTRQNGTVTSQ